LIARNGAGFSDRKNVSGRAAVIFGGAGFFGTHLARAMAAGGEYDRILSVDRDPPANPVAGVEYMRGDVNHPISIANAPAGAEVYNFAAVHTTPGHEDWEYFWTNEWGAINVCNFAEAIGAPLMVFSSSIAAYGPTEAPLDESGPFAPTSAYGRSKLIAESIHRMWLKAGPGRKLRIVRPAVIFGRGERGNFTRLAAMLKRGRFYYPGRDDAVKACGYVGELVRSMLFVRDLPDDEIAYNFAYPERYTTRDIVAAFCAEGGFRLPKTVVPAWLMLLGGLTFEILAALGLKTSINRARVMKLTLSTNIVPRKLMELNYPFETDLKSGLARWRADTAGGNFV
jgi:nucleoside-diphosphate-sugar epimerase